MEEFTEDQKSLLEKAMRQLTDEMKKAQEDFNNYDFKGSDVEMLFRMLPLKKTFHISNAYIPEEFPEGWSATRYEKAMAKIEQLWFTLYPFTEEERLFVRYGGEVYEILSVVDEWMDLYLQQPTIKPKGMVIDWEDVLTVAKKEPFEQAMWFLKKNDLTESEKTLCKQFFDLGHTWVNK